MENSNVQKNKLKKIFSERLKSLTGDMNPTEIERLTGIIRQNISKYLTGTALPKLEILAVLADTFNVSYDYLLGGDDNHSYGTDYIMKETGLTKESIRTLKEFSLNKNDFLTLFAINKIISSPSGREFYSFLSKYVSAQNLDTAKKESFYYYVFPLHMEFADCGIDLYRENMSYDDMIYYILIKKIQQLTNDIKSNRNTKHEIKAYFDEIFKNS